MKAEACSKFVAAGGIRRLNTRMKKLSLAKLLSSKLTIHGEPLLQTILPPVSLACLCLLQPHCDLRSPCANEDRASIPYQVPVCFLFWTLGPGRPITGRLPRPLHPDKNKASAGPDPKLQAPSSKLEFTFLLAEGLLFHLFCVVHPSNVSIPFVLFPLRLDSHTHALHARHDGLRSSQSVGGM